VRAFTDTLGRPGGAFLTALATAALLTACGKPGSNAADCDDGQAGVPCSERTPDEEAQLAMEEGDFTAAIEILSAAVEAEPDEYKRRPLLAAAYAKRAGFDIFNIVNTDFAGDGLLSAMSTFLPTPAAMSLTEYDAALADMFEAIAVLAAMPADVMAASATDKYGASAVLQVTLYRSAYSIMYLNKFAISATTGTFDPSQLATMSQEDALVIVENLAAAAEVDAGEGGTSLQDRLREAVAKIESEGGTSDRDRLLAYTQGQYGGGLR
jgi:hypothetical protein